MKGHSYQFKRVVQWFMARASSSADKHRANQLSEMLTWQQRLKQQLTYSMPRPTKTQLTLLPKATGRTHQWWSWPLRRPGT